MIDDRARKLLNPVLERAVTPLVRRGVHANAITVLGFSFGVASIVSISLRENYLALSLWLANRLLDGIDGVLARRSKPTDLGGFLDIVFDFIIYGGLLVGIAIGYPGVRLEAIVLLGTYYVSGTALLALSSITERRSKTQMIPPEKNSKSIRFIGGLAEGGETIIFYVIVMALPRYAVISIDIFIAMVAITAVQRVAIGISCLSARCDGEFSQNECPSQTNSLGSKRESRSEVK
ncbi:MAG: CDP-alcohol phosphatidyltransferase family protein [Actinomycetota bacterium]|nr:CDP-alcohol phosphatidyltransferase family protein [Actinomycetota bacterium]